MAGFEERKMAFRFPSDEGEISDFFEERVSDPSPFRMAFRLSSDQGKPPVSVVNPVLARSESGMAFRMASDQKVRPFSTAEVYVSPRQDYQPFYDALGKNLESTQSMLKPPLVDQSYGPAYEALGKAANHDAVRRYQSEMDDQSGVYPKPGDQPSCELDATSAITYGVPSGVISAIPMGPKAPKTITGRVTQGVTEASKKQLQSLLHDGAVMDNKKGQYWTEEKQKEIESDYLKNLLFHAIFGGG